jgi:23S rRNA pseudouridine955/2504/2580 synthase
MARKHALPDRLAVGQILRLPPHLRDGVAVPAGKGAGSARTGIGAPSPVADARLRKDFDAMVIAEGRDWLAINKPGGLAVQGGTGTKKHVDGMLQALAGRFRRPAAPCAPHRQGHIWSVVAG